MDTPKIDTMKWHGAVELDGTVYCKQCHGREFLLQGAESVRGYMKCTFKCSKCGKKITAIVAQCTVEEGEK